MYRESQHNVRIGFKNVKKYIPDALLSLLNLLGPYGSVFASALEGFFTTKRFSNIEHTLKIMGEKLKHIDMSNVKDYMCSEEFIHLFLSVVQKSQIEHQEDKRRSYGLMLANMALDSETRYDQKNMFISLLSEMEMIHIKTLNYLQTKSQNEEDDNKKWASLKEIKSTIPDLVENSNFVVVAILQKLANFGLIKSKGESENKLMMGINPIGLWFHSLFAITDLGMKFLEFLKD
jgi:hypothetical protein